MRVIGNILWILLGGLEIAFTWVCIGALCYLTVVGIPLGRQAFKMAKLTLTPFGKDVVYGGGMASTTANIVWCLLFGIWMAIAYVISGVVTCMSVVGIPFGIQAFKMAKLSLWPFGAGIVETA